MEKEMGADILKTLTLVKRLPGDFLFIVSCDS